MEFDTRLHGRGVDGEIEVNVVIKLPSTFLACCCLTAIG